MPRRDDDELDLLLSNIDTGLRLLSLLQEHNGTAERVTIERGAAYLIEKLISESAQARDAYDRGRRPETPTEG